MTVETGIIIAAIGLVISVLSYFFGVKKQSNADVEKRAHFEGEIKATLKRLVDDVDKIQQKFDKFSGNYIIEIDKKIQEHEARYHHHE